MIPIARIIPGQDEFFIGNQKKTAAQITGRRFPCQKWPF